MANIEHLLDDIRKDKYCQEMRETFCNALIETNKAAEEMESTVKKIKNEITSLNANAELIDAREGETTLGNKIRKMSKQLSNKEVDVTLFGFENGINANVTNNTSIIQGLIDNNDDLVMYFPSGINKIGKLNLGLEKNITFRGKSSSFATSITKNSDVIDTYSKILVNLDASEPWIEQQNCTIIFDKISCINGAVDSNGTIIYSNNNLMIKTEANNIKGKVFATESSFIGWKQLGGDPDILTKESGLLHSCWLASRCRFRNNTIALAQLVDGRVSDCSFNKNEYAIYMNNNSGFTTIQNNRVEWNTVNGIVVKNAHDVKITDNEFDRNGKSGLIVDTLVGGNIESNIFRRNGTDTTLATDDFDNNIHFFIQNCTDVIVKGNNTVAKSILDTGGAKRPSNVSNISNNTNCIVSENILNGCTKTDKLLGNKIENNTNCVIANNIPDIINS